MGKRWKGLWLLPLLPLLSGCSAVGQKADSAHLVYGIMAVLSLFLLAGCMALVKKNRGWFLLLFSSVAVVNLGYALLSASTGLSMALWANRVAYLGSVCLAPAMLMILLKVTGTCYKKWLPWVLLTSAAVMYFIAGSPGILDIYYKEVSFAVVNGAGVLVKVYGPLHPVYLVYLVGYFAAMVAVLCRCWLRKTVDSVSQALALTAAVTVNLGVWLVEQLTHIDFELLAVSYILSELFLLGVHLMIRENQRLKELVRQKEAEAARIAAQTDPEVSGEQAEIFRRGMDALTPTERTVFEAYLAGCTTKQIMESLKITENTLKFHNKNIYGKLGVSSRKQLVRISKQLEEMK